MLDRRIVRDTTIAIALMTGMGEAQNAAPVAVRAEGSKTNRRQRRTDGVRSYVNFGARARNGSIDEADVVCSPYLEPVPERVVRSLVAGC